MWPKGKGPPAPVWPGDVAVDVWLDGGRGNETLAAPEPPLALALLLAGMVKWVGAAVGVTEALAAPALLMLLLLLLAGMV